MHGRFISFEGGDGAGKTSQINFLAKKLHKKNIKVIVTREPGGSKGSEQIRKLLLIGKTNDWSPISEVLLFSAGRSNHLENVICPNLKNGIWVLCDRFLDSTRAYQGIAGNVPQELITVIEKYVVKNFFPDRTYILDLDPKIGLARANKRMNKNNKFIKKNIENRFEKMKIKFHIDLRRSYLDIARNEPSRCLIINAKQDFNKIQNIIWKDIQKFIK